MLPKLNTLHRVPVVGHLRDTVPSLINCTACGREIATYDALRLVVDTVSECPIVSSSDGTYFMSRTLLEMLETAHATGYACRPIDVSQSGDFARFRDQSMRTGLIEPLSYLAITARCDGPWVRNRVGGECQLCGQPVPLLIDSDHLYTEIFGDVRPPTLLVNPDTWHGEDIFYLSEPGPPVVTERFVSALIEAGSERISGSHSAFMQDRRIGLPEHQEGQTLHSEPCLTLGPADWAEQK